MNKKKEERSEGAKAVNAGSSVCESNEKKDVDHGTKLEACLQ